MPHQTSKYLTVSAVAERYACHPSSVWRWVAQKQFPQPIRIGGITRWLEAEIEAHDAKAAAQREAA